MEKTDRSFIYVLLISIIVCALIGFCIVKSGENYDKELYSEVYEELDELEEYITDNSKYNKEIDSVEYESDNYKRGKIIAIMTIDKLDLKYPILKEDTEENLKVAPAKFWGADPNEIGNLCVVGHNYGNSKYFSKLSSLMAGDIVKVMDTQGNDVSYKVYEKKIINENDLSCTSQLTNGKKEVTLITCTDNSIERLVVKCIEV